MQPLGEIEDRAAFDQRGISGIRRQAAVDATGRSIGSPCRRDPATDDAFALVGLEPIDPGGVLRQALPDRQQKPSHHMQDAVGELRHLCQFRVPGRGEGSLVRLAPMGLIHCPHGDAHRFHRPDQPHAALDLAIIQHDAGGGDLHGGATGSLVDEQSCAGIIQFRQGCIERDRLIALALGERQ